MLARIVRPSFAPLDLVGVVELAVPHPDVDVQCPVMPFLFRNDRPEQGREIVLSGYPGARRRDSRAGLLGILEAWVDRSSSVFRALRTLSSCASVRPGPARKAARRGLPPPESQETTRESGEEGCSCLKNSGSAPPRQGMFSMLRSHGKGAPGLGRHGPFVFSLRGLWTRTPVRVYPYNTFRLRRVKLENMNEDITAFHRLHALRPAGVLSPGLGCYGALAQTFSQGVANVPGGIGSLGVSAQGRSNRRGQEPRKRTFG